MTMQTGLAIIERDETETKAIFVDHEVIDFARQNAKTKKRMEAAAQAQIKADHIQRKAEKAKARRKAYNLKTLAHVLTGFTVSGAVAWAGMAGMIQPIISIPVSLFCLCAACLRLGAWFGKRVK